MFEFIGKWDTTLKDIQQDMEFSIKGEVKSWVVHLQTYLEKLLKLFYYSQYPKFEKLTLGDLLNDQSLVDSIINKAGFADISWIRAVNNAANENKHNAKLCDFTDQEISEWIKKAHKLSMCIYNFMHQDKIDEMFDIGYVTKLRKEKEESEESLIAYADSLIYKRSQTIELLRNEVDELKISLQLKDSEFSSCNEEKKKLHRLNTHYQNEIYCYDKAIREIFGSTHSALGFSNYDLDRTGNGAHQIYERLVDKFSNMLKETRKPILHNNVILELGFDALLQQLNKDPSGREFLKKHISDYLTIYLDIYNDYCSDAFQDSRGILKRHLQKEIDQQHIENERRKMIDPATSPEVDSRDYDSICYVEYNYVTTRRGSAEEDEDELSDLQSYTEYVYDKS